MADATDLLTRAYAAFNLRDTASALALMTDDVRWPKASEGGSVIGKEEIGAYWARQWQEFDPHVEPLSIAQEQDGRLHVRVQQRVKALDGTVLFDGEVQHIFTLRDGHIAAMDLGDAHEAAGGATSAFARRP